MSNYLTTDILTMSAFAGIAVVLAWRRSDDWAVLFIAMMLLLTGLLYTQPAANGPLPIWIIACLFALAEIGQVGFFFLFPDGRFIPRWSAWLLLPMLIWRPAAWAIFYLPGYRRLPHSAESYGVIPQNSIDTLLLVVLLALGLIAQIYRYRRVSTPVQHQQVKWLLFGAAITVAVVSTYVFVFNVFRLPQQPGTPPFFLVAGRRSRPSVSGCEMKSTSGNLGPISSPWSTKRRSRSTCRCGSLLSRSVSKDTRRRLLPRYHPCLMLATTVSGILRTTQQNAGC